MFINTGFTYFKGKGSDKKVESGKWKEESGEWKYHK
jgi:hypothetical protein